MSKHYYIFNKPYNVLSQFTKEIEQHVTLQDYLQVEKDVYPIGRLDRDSEGLLLLTNDNSLKTKLLDPKSESSKTYAAQVDGAITKDAILQLSKGVKIKLKKGNYTTKSCIVKHNTSSSFKDRVPPIRYRANIPTSWISITLQEGKNRQIRKMCAAVGFPVLRLIRTSIKSQRFEDVAPGNFRLLTQEEIVRLKS